MIPVPTAGPAIKRTVNPARPVTLPLAKAVRSVYPIGLMMVDAMNARVDGWTATTGAAPSAPKIGLGTIARPAPTLGPELAAMFAPNPTLIVPSVIVTNAEMVGKIAKPGQVIAVSAIRATLTTARAMYADLYFRTKTKIVRIVFLAERIPTRDVSIVTPTGTVRIAMSAHRVFSRGQAKTVMSVPMGGRMTLTPDMMVNAPCVQAIGGVAIGMGTTIAVSADPGGPARRA